MYMDIYIYRFIYIYIYIYVSIIYIYVCKCIHFYTRRSEILLFVQADVLEDLSGSN